MLLGHPLKARFFRLKIKCLHWKAAVEQFPFVPKEPKDERYQVHLP
jgi:hypothetical protein